MSGGAYFMPRHPSEADRLDIQHYALRSTLGADYLAPVRMPTHVLDVGCGTATWAFEMAKRFPGALVVGLDLVPNDKQGPANYRFIRGNVLGGLPFGDHQFDFVHQRLLVSGIPVPRWPGVVKDLVRVTRRGGWVELVEGIIGTESAGPASERLLELLHRFIRPTGLDADGTVTRSLESYLTHAGAVDVRSRTVQLPVGEWGGEIGSWMATNARSVFTRLEGTFEARFGVSPEECRDLVRAMLDECEHHHTTTTFKIGIGRRF